MAHIFQRFEVGPRYEPLRLIGKGSYGLVCAAKDRKEEGFVAIKKIAQIFDNVSDSRRLLREIKLLRYLYHENVVSILDIVQPSNPASFEDLYVVSELMDTDLHRIIRSEQLLLDDHCQYIMYQLLRALKYIHSANVLHRDLKPSNVLINVDCEIKICDFGLARTDSQVGLMTEYVTTRWYRAPELLTSQDTYDTAVDMWAAGCILAEVLLRRPLFTGKNAIDQLDTTIRVRGSMSEEELELVQIERARKHIKSLPYSPKSEFTRIFEGRNPAAADLVSKLLVYDPRKRLTAKEALEHPYFELLHKEELEPDCDTKLDLPFEGRELTKAEFRSEILRELKYYRLT